MSEEDRSRLYAWLREQTDETLAEYLMSCLAPAPLSDLVTKEFLTTQLAQFVTKEFLTAQLAQFVTKEFLTAQLAQFVTKEFLTAQLAQFATKEELASLEARVASLEAKVASLEAKVASLEAKVDRLAAMREDDRRENRVRQYWLAGIGLSAAVPIWLSTAGVIG